MLAFAAVLLCACDGGRSGFVSERIHSENARFEVRGSGELRASKSTPLLVPGRPGAQLRQVLWMLPEGSVVAANDLVAKFSVNTTQLQLAQANIDLQRTALKRDSKLAALDTTKERLVADLHQVDGELGIAKRYARAGQDVIARNDMLDAVQDERYLGEKRAALEWRQQRSDALGKAEVAVIDAQHTTFQSQARESQADLDALELHAPHAGVVLLEPDWSGLKPHIGTTLVTGDPLGSLPDLDAMEVELLLPEILAREVKVGAKLVVSPEGRPDQSVETKITAVDAAAQERVRDSPVKFIGIKAPIPEDAMKRYAWGLGQRFVGQVILLEADHVISVPNIAVSNDGPHSRVKLKDGGKFAWHEVSVGVRGPTRTQILSGLKEGDEIQLNLSNEGSATP